MDDQYESKEDYDVNILGLFAGLSLMDKLMVFEVMVGVICGIRFVLSVFTGIEPEFGAMGIYCFAVAFAASCLGLQKMYGLQRFLTGLLAGAVLLIQFFFMVYILCLSF